MAEYSSVLLSCVDWLQVLHKCTENRIMCFVEVSSFSVRGASAGQDMINNYSDNSIPSDITYDWPAYRGSLFLGSKMSVVSLQHY